MPVDKKRPRHVQRFLQLAAIRNLNLNFEQKQIDRFNRKEKRGYSLDFVRCNMLMATLLRHKVIKDRWVGGGRRDQIEQAQPRIPYNLSQLTLWENSKVFIFNA